VRLSKISRAVHVENTGTFDLRFAITIDRLFGLAVRVRHARDVYVSSERMSGAGEPYELYELKEQLELGEPYEREKSFLQAAERTELTEAVEKLAKAVF